MRKPVVGETLFLVDPGPDVHGGVPCTVYKVGRKYFYVREDGWRDLKFCIDSWREAVKWGVAKNLLFESEQAYLSERIRDRATRILVKRLQERKFDFGEILDAYTALGLCLVHEEEIEGDYDG